MSINKVNIDTCKYREGFIALRNVHAQVQHSTVQDPNRNKLSVKTIGDYIICLCTAFKQHD